MTVAVVVRVLLIFLLVAVLAGGIAMLGNQLGRRIGRRKMTVFGLRPRHTSIVITAATGSLIALLTLILAMIASRDVLEAVTGSQERLNRLQERETQLRRRVAQLAEDVRRGTIIWNYGERVALVTIPAGFKEGQVAEAIGRLLAQVNSLTIRKNNRVALVQGEQLFESDQILVKYSREHFREWVERYTELEQPVGIWVVVTENCLFKDPVPVDIESFPVRVVFTEGELVYSREIRPEEFLVDWYLFLEELKATALREGMIEMNESLGGEITGDGLRDISRRVETHGGPVLLKAIAKRELYQSSNLDVAIEVEPL